MFAKALCLRVNAGGFRNTPTEESVHDEVQGPKIAELVALNDKAVRFGEKFAELINGEELPKPGKSLIRKRHRAWVRREIGHLPVCECDRGRLNGVRNPHADVGGATLISAACPNEDAEGCVDHSITSTDIGT
jgi:hypothetical protein